ncbi:Uncharacterised protein [Kluyvera cryocrescens]|uniref:Uroporphyrinogen-III synthase n=1 Tax=Kluyvera cryocrescens TaxID=580 RepID=A0A485B6X4_KLUCR|nr:Uncharacterised protein [Kluyvera cryocrescens]
MTILVTRPSPQGEELVSPFARAGAGCLEFPAH